MNDLPDGYADNSKIVHALIQRYKPIHGHVPIMLVKAIYAALDEARADERRKLVATPAPPST